MLKKLAIALVLVFALLAAWAAVIALVNRQQVRRDSASIQIVRSQNAVDFVGPWLQVTTWNIGYAGMGAEADFVMDGGTQMRPAQKALVQRNAAWIAKTIPSLRSDVYFIQELAEPSWSTYQTNVRRLVSRALAGYDHVFTAEVNTRFVPPPVRTRVGNAFYSALKIDEARVRALPVEPTFALGIFRKRYGVEVIEFVDQSSEDRWVLMNIHLSSFDTDTAAVREAQVRRVLALAKEAYDGGAHVVVGGDWNLLLSDYRNDNTTSEEDLFWVREFPQELVPDGWTWAVDDSTPTVRTAHKPYVAGENATFIIDGLLFSPNVNILDVSTRNFGFQYTDHHPVTAILKSAE